ncbi:glycine--tRNA ligase subunit beta [Sphingomonas alpina]|uniref:Glycine--tRNA ligase beta subunit n=1 Tax=Sphingomonas alpina TaxID=653931 RepID=A0A7H0LEA1_9SPHN|nr:glycine--tRNA ligase subunit beta [Sphingomonas alpina]
MTDFLLELRSEEIPARMQDKARGDLARLFAAELDKAGLKAGALETLATPRRLTLIARDLPLQTEAVSEETKGPKTSAPPQALEGFLRKTGLTRDQLTERDGIYFAVVEKPGRATADVLAEAIPAIIRAFPWPKSMRWGDASASTESLKWVRPLQGIVALLGETVVPCEIAGIASGATTVGHRFHAPGAIAITSAATYAEQLRDAHVIVDQAERRQIIALGATMAARKAGLELIQDEGLLTENAGLTEWPVPLLGRFDEAFLAVPPEVIQLTARVNQKYFVCRDAEGKLANAFVCTANIDAADGGAKIIDGNRKVLAARLSDAKFFYETDLKVPLEEQAAKLDRIVFHEKLGTVADKVDRVAKLARWLVEEGIVGADPTTRHPRESGDPASSASTAAPAETAQGSGIPAFAGMTAEERARLADMAERAARLCKADLVTGMVGEFPELQGLMGGYYATAQGEPVEVAEAIRDHYKPVGQGDDVPTAPVTVAVSLADKLDTVTAFFLMREPPTGSKDPYALRRAMLGIVALLTSINLRANFVVMAGQILLAFQDQIKKELEDSVSELSADVELGREWNRVLAFVNENKLLKAFDIIKDVHRYADRKRRFEVISSLIGGDAQEQLRILQSEYDFALDRLKVQQREAGVRHDLIDAVFALGGEDDLVRLLARVHALQSFVTTEDGTNLLAGYKRAANILKKEGFTAAEDKDVAYDRDPAEGALVAALDSAEPRARDAVAAEEFEGAMAALASLRGPIDQFFEEVTVNDPDPDKRTARLALLARVRDAVHSVADFSKIEG